MLLNEVLEARRARLTAGPGNITEAGRHENPYLPVDDSKYRHAAWRRTVDASTLKALRQTTDLIPVDPWAKSALRRSGLAVWDAVLGLKGPASRQPTVLRGYEIKQVRGGNQHWPVLQSALQRCGPLGEAGTLQRPQDALIFDFTAVQDGWMLLNAAHVLAHLRGNDTIQGRDLVYYTSPTVQAFQQAAAEVAASCLFGIPIRITPGSTTWHGIEIHTVPSFDDPMLRVPVNSPQPDSTTVLIAAGILIQPPPSGLELDERPTRPGDRWACCPSAVIFSGWEAVDAVMKASLVGGKKLEQQAFALHPADLVTPVAIPGLVQRARELGTEPSGYCSVWDWINNRVQDHEGQLFIQRWLATPPLPCSCCAAINRMTPDCPERPPRCRHQARHKGWLKWRQQMKRISCILKAAAIEVERKQQGSLLAAGRFWRSRYRAFKQILLAMHQGRVYKSAKLKYREGKRLTKAEQRIFNERRAARVLLPVTKANTTCDS